MVELADIQAAYYMVAATGVLVAAAFYILNLRETTRNRRATLTNNLMESFLSEEGSRRYLELISMQWSDFDDFKEKYDSRVNVNNFVRRAAFWNSCDLVGYQYEAGLIDIGTVYNTYGTWIIRGWLKFKPIIEEYRKTDWSRDQYEHWERLADVLGKMKSKKDELWSSKAESVFTTHNVQH